MTRRVLLVDDDAAIREVAQACLETMAGWEVLTAPSGPEGIETAARTQPDAILLDVMMPGCDGLTTLERLRAQPATAGIPVLLVTAKVAPADLDRYRGCGAAGTIAKPFDPLGLADEVAAALGWSA